MPNRLKIISNGHDEKEVIKKEKQLNDGLLDYISDLLTEPTKESKPSLIRAFEKSEKTLNVESNNSTIESNVSKNNINKQNVVEEKATLKKQTNNRKKLNQNKIFSEPDPRLKKVSKLLERIAILPLTNVKTEELTQDASKVETQIVVNQQTEEIRGDLTQANEENTNQQIQTTADNSFAQRKDSSLRDSLEENFQTLIFDVNNLPLAVPLIKLGGIVNISNQDITPLVGTPDWFLGLVPNERGNLMVVDTQKFIMPERPVENENSYDYLIVLDNSQWALACHSVGDAKNMHASDIRWSSKLSKRPWFAGMVVEYMSALIEVDSLINQLAEQIVE